ncbi:MAG: hypothetical protein ACF8NJ_03470 [Phycisphaerales bacterium JB038]
MVGGILLSAGLAEADQSSQERERQLRDWIERRLGDGTVGVPKGEGVIIEYAQTTSTWMADSEISQLLADVRDHPDHPQLGRATGLRNLSDKQSRTEFRGLYLDSSAWRREFEMIDAAVGAGLNRVAAGDGDVRWVSTDLSGAQRSVSIIRSGVPFEVGYNAGQDLNDLRRHLAIFLADGLPLTRGDSIALPTLDRTRWQAEVSGDGARYLITGRILESGEPAVVSVSQLAESGEGEAKWSLTLGDYYVESSLGRAVPHLAIETFPSGVSDTCTLTSVECVSPGVVERAGKLPKFSDDVRVLDFRQEVSVDPYAPIKPKRMVWTQKGGRDFYEMVDDATQTSISDAAMSRREGPPQSTASDHSASKDDGATEEWTTSRFMALGALLVVIFGVPVSVYWFRSR